MRRIEEMPEGVASSGITGGDDKETSTRLVLRLYLDSAQFSRIILSRFCLAMDMPNQQQEEEEPESSTHEADDDPLLPDAEIEQDKVTVSEVRQAMRQAHYQNRSHQRRWNDDNESCLDG